MELEELYVLLSAYLRRYYKPETKRKESNQNFCGFVPLYNYEDLLSKYISSNLEADFSSKLLRMISNRKLTNPEVYKKADMTKQKFSRLISTGRAKKDDVFILGLALHLSLSELEELLQCAGFAISFSIKTDVIIRFCFENKIYSLYDVNSLLEKFNGDCLFDKE